MSTTLNDFNLKIKEVREKTNSESIILKEKLALLQHLKEHCARTLEQATMDAEFEETVKNELLKIQSEIAQLKRQGITKPAVTTPKPAASIPESTSSQISPNISASPEKQDFKQGTDLPPSDFIPITDSKDMWQTVPTTAFDPMESPILRRLISKQPIISDKLISSPTNALETQSKTPVQAPHQQEAPTLIPDPVEKSSSTPAVPLTSDQLTPFPHNPIPSLSNDGPSISRKSIMLEIPQLKIKLDIIFNESIIALGREDFENVTQSMKLPSDFFSPILTKKKAVNSGPSEHFIIEQIKPGEFSLKDRSNLQKTFFKNTFVNDQGIPIQDGESFILPVLINNQIASLTLIFHIKP